MFLYAWLIGVAVTAVLLVILAIILVDELPDPDHFGVYVGIISVLSAIWPITYLLSIVAVIGVKLKKRYQKPIMDWLEKTFGEEETTNEK